MLPLSTLNFISEAIMAKVTNRLEEMTSRYTKEMNLASYFWNLSHKSKKKDLTKRALSHYTRALVIERKLNNVGN